MSRRRHTNGGRFFLTLHPISTTSRITSEEKRHLERITHEDPETTYASVRRGAEVHRQVRQYAQRTIKPGMSMTEIAELIEDGTRALVEEDGLRSGIGFPTGLSVNEVAAHYTPNAGDTKSEWKALAVGIWR